MNRKQIFGLFLFIIGFTLIIIILIPIIILIINYIEGNLLEDGGIFLYFLFGFLGNPFIFAILITLKGFFFIKSVKTARGKRNYFISLIVIGLIIIGINIIAIYGTLGYAYSASFYTFLFIPCMIFATLLICYERKKVLSCSKTAEK